MSTVNFGTIGGTINLTKSLGNRFEVVLADDLTIQGFGGAEDGDVFYLLVSQDGGGSHLVTLPSAAYDGGSPPTMPSAANKKLLVSYVYLDGNLYELTRTLP